MLTVKQQDEVLNSLTYMPPCGFRSVPPWIRWRQVIVTLVLSHRFKEMVESGACFPQRQSHSMKWAKFFLLHIFYTVCILEKTTFILNCYWRKQVQTESKCKKVHINIGKKLSVKVFNHWNSCLERLWSLHYWRYSTGHSPEQSGAVDPALNRGFGLDALQMSLSVSVFLWFCGKGWDVCC